MRRIIAALVAAQLSTVPAQAAERQPEQSALQGRVPLAQEPSHLPAGDETAIPARAGDAPAATRAEDGREDRPRKGKSTGDKVLTGAAVILGIGAVAVGGLLIAIFVG
ncbi:MAG TPA: hypothetical protein VE053_07225 [Allosphingosinicella sp.]|nr:hypothetical protein [Allosphingosinicella sp.]